MAKRKAKKAARAAKPAGKAAATRRSSAKRPTARRPRAQASFAKKSGAARPRLRRAAQRRPEKRRRKLSFRPNHREDAAGKTPRLDRARRTLDDIVPTPPSTLDLDRNASAARSGRAELAEKQREHRGMNDLDGGDPDVDVEDAYFTGEEAPGGDNPTPDQDIVDDIGKALGVEYEDNEELKAADKVVERDKHRWELDPASAEDYKDRK